MSPAGVNIWPPLSSQTNPDSNPIPGFAASAPNNAADNCKRSEKFSVFGDASEFQIPGFRTGPVSSGRAKPRLVKLRKQLHRRSTVVPGNLDFVERNCGAKVEQAGGKVESLVSENVGSVFRAEGTQFNGNFGISVPEADNQKLGNTGFVFGANRENVSVQWSTSDSNSGLVSGSNAPVGFEFLANGSNKGFNLVFKAGESNNCTEKTKSDIGMFASSATTNGRVPVSVFEFGSSSKKSSNFDECLDEVNLYNEPSKSWNGISRDQNGSINDECCTQEFKSTGDMASASSMHSLYNLHNELKNLNIDDFKNVTGVGRKKFSSKSRSWDRTSHEWKSELFSDSAKGTGGKEFESSDKNKSCNMAHSLFGTSSLEPLVLHAGPNRSQSEGFLSQCQANDETQLNGAAVSSLFSSFPLDSQGNSFASKAPAISQAGKDVHEMSAASTSESSGVLLTEFKAPEWHFPCLKASLFPELIEKKEFSLKGRKKKSKMSQIMRGKLNQHSLQRQQADMNPTQNEGNTQENPKFPGNCSPMDFSPYEDTTSAPQWSAEASVVSNGFTQLDNNNVQLVCPLKVATGLREGKGLDKDDKKSTGPHVGSSCYQSERPVIGDKSSKQSTFGAEGVRYCFNSAQVCTTGCPDVTSAEDTVDLNAEQNSEPQLSFASGLQDPGHLKFSFSASSCQHNSSSTSKPLRRRKNRRKAAHKPFTIAPEENAKVQEGDCFSFPRKVANKSEAKEEVKQGPISSTVAFEEACETWRIRGNQAYQRGDMSKAEDFYTRGINSVPSCKTAGCCLRPLVICYSNRAATRMSLGCLRAALSDCVTAAALDPKFLKVQIRAGNCHLALGEVDDALHYFNKCLESGGDVCLDRRITIEAATGQQNAQKVAECMDHGVKLLEQRTSDAAPNALDAFEKALSISPYSERLLEMKVESMFMLRRYGQAIQLCEDTLCAAEKNFASVGTDGQFVDVSSSHGRSFSSARLWRRHRISKSQFYMGRLEAALDSLDELEPMRSINDEYASKILASSLSLGITIRELLDHKNAGNEAFRLARYTEAVEHYSAALSSNVESRPFAAICFCNRAAAYQAMDQIADAIADCSLAIALDGSYHKAVSRRATLHEMIRDYEQAARDLQRLVSIFENQSEGKSRQSGTPGRAHSSTKELRQAHWHMSLMEEKAKKGSPLDMYLVLGVKVSDSVLEIKRAYRKAALRHHPDKAGQFLARSESGDEGRLWKEIVEEVHIDADRLFKMIGEAYAVLSDATKRSQYDLDEEIRKGSKQSNGSRPNGKTSDGYSYPFRRSRR
uniref:J domain-containing protein n=2 Tax=Rhizophora mucronata TaxID=61149 RepID=A0A2P2K761_RHIMU